VLPTEAEVAERRARHAKLDAITARLLEVDRQTPGGGGSRLAWLPKRVPNRQGRLVLDDV
jgi:hypothetical protein